MHGFGTCPYEGAYLLRLPSALLPTISMLLFSTPRCLNVTVKYAVSYSFHRRFGAFADITCPPIPSEVAALLLLPPHLLLGVMKQHIDLANGQGVCQYPWQTGWSIVVRMTTERKLLQIVGQMTAGCSDDSCHQLQSLDSLRKWAVAICASAGLWRQSLSLRELAELRSCMAKVDIIPGQLSVEAYTEAANSRMSGLCSALHADLTEWNSYVGVASKLLWESAFS